MAEPGTDAAAGCPEFSELWRKIFEDDHSKRQSRRGAEQMAVTATAPGWKGLQSPRFRGGSRFPGSNNAESPGDVEASQDIFWDGASPTQTGSGNMNTRAVEISEIVNRIAPKNIKPKVTESSVLHWIDDGAMPCTPDIPKPRVRKRSSRHSSVEDLMKLAKQFDKNMQQDEETSVKLNTVTCKLHESINASENNLKDPKCPSSLEQAEAELHALFDSSTQGVSGRLSEDSVSSQDRKDQPETFAFAVLKQLEPKPPGKHSTDDLFNFEDDWDNDDLLNDSLILALTQDPNDPLDVNPKMSAKSHTNTKKISSVFHPTKNMDPVQKPLDNPCKTSFSSLQKLCPKPKTTNRTTFKLEPNPHFQSRLDKEASKSSFTVIQPKSKSTEQRPAIIKTMSNPLPDKVTNKVCDTVERISNSQLKEACPKHCEETPKGPIERHQNSTDLLQVNTEFSGTSGVSANRRSSGSFVRSNSLPVTTCKTGEWNIPLKGADHKSGTSQSYPGGQVGVEKFKHGRDFSRAFLAESGNVDMKPHTVTTRLPQNSKFHNTPFKRTVSDAAITSNKVFVTSHTTGKCSAAEIERKKQEALARRRLRMQTMRIKTIELLHPD